MADETPAPVDYLAQAKAEIAAFEAANHPPPPPPAKSANGDASANVNGAANGAPATGLADSAAKTQPATNVDEKTLATDETVDTSFLPDEVRTEITVKSSAAAKKLKSMVMGHKAVTEGFQEVAAIKRDADNWRRATEDPVKAEKITRILLDGRVVEEPAKAEEPEIPADFDFTDPKAIVSLIGKTVRRVVTSEVVPRIDAVKADIERPASAKQAINVALGSYAETKEIAPATMKAAVDLWKADLAEAGVDPLTVDPRAVPALIAPYVRLTRVAPKPPAAAQTNGAAANGRAGGLSEVASPNGRTSTSSGSTLVVPRHIAEGRPPRNDVERNEEYAHAFAKRFGPDVNPG